jgi:hypothetical protein
MKKIFFFLGFVVFFFSCSKDKFNTKPKLTFKSVNATSFAANQEIKMEMIASDKEGDLTDTLFIYKVNKNCGKDTLKLSTKLPAFPTTTNLETTIQFRAFYNSTSIPNLPKSFTCSPAVNDSCVFTFILKDKAGNKSDPVFSPTIVLLK